MKLGKIGINFALAALLAGSLLSVPATGQDTAAASSESIAVPAGPALTEGEIIILLQAKVSVDTIQKFVQTRGAGFGTNKEVGRRIISAGGNVALIGTISLNQKESAVASAQQPEDGKRKK